MPWKPPKPCSAPGCGELTHDRYCPAHARQARRQADAHRGSASKRGYGRRWQKLRKAFLASNPICALCPRPATEVDHIVAKAKGGDDKWSNLQALCKPCHARKTAQEDGSFGRPRRGGGGPISPTHPA